LATSSTIPAALANTGFNGAPFLASGLALAVVGGSLMLIARRKASQ
jgi:LPXTG-motif cell wall-anchored protein